jgi:hypothetical protein
LTDDLAFLLGGGRLSAGLRLERAYWKKNHDSSKQYKANRRVFFSTKSMFNVSSPLFADVPDYIPDRKINLQHRQLRRFRPCHGSAHVASQLDTGFVQPYRENFPAQEWHAGMSPMSAHLMTSLTRGPFGSAQHGQVQPG